MADTLTTEALATGHAGPVSALAGVMADALAHWAPPPKISTADWIEANVTLPADVSDTPGLMRLFPTQHGLCEAVDDPEVDRIVWQKCARQGATSLGVAITAAFVANDPKNIMWVQPVQDDARDMVVSQVEPIFAASPALAGLLVQDEKKRDTIQSRRFPGGSAKFLGAAPRNMRRHFIHKLFLDEVDAYPPAPGEGDIVTLAINRTRTARDRLIFMASTPTDAATSRIAREYEASDKRIYEIQCPNCSEFFELLWQHIKWEKTDAGEHLPDTAHAVCPHHGCVIEESSKATAVAAGRWRATAPQVKGIAGFKSNALISTIEHARWSQVVREFIAAKGDPDLMRVWSNTLMAETFLDKAGEGLDEHALARRAEAFGIESIPADIRVLTLGVDVQAYGLECLTLGHSATQMFVLDYRTIDGAPTDDSTWRDLDDFIRRRFPHPLGGTLGFDAVAIDSGDGNVTDIVYAFAKPRFSARRVVSIKGQDGNRPLIERSSKPGLYIVGVDGAKSRLFGLLETEGHIRFSQDLPARFYEELCSERRVTFYKTGQPRKRWERIKGMRAEGLDSCIYAMAVRGLVGVDLTRRENELRGVASAPQIPAVIRSQWMQRGRE